MVEQHPHDDPSRRQGIIQAARCVLQHLLYVHDRYARKPLQKFIYRRATFQIQKQRGNRHARSSENPGATKSLGVPLYCRAGGPIKHRELASIISATDLECQYPPRQL